jgi:hypothetical protein
MPARATAAVAGAAGVHHEPGRLVHDQHHVVLVDDVERDALRPVRRLRRIRLRPDLDPLAAPDLLLRLCRARVEPDVPVAQPVLQAAARVLGKHARERLVQAQAG